MRAGFGRRRLTWMWFPAYMTGFVIQVPESARDGRRLTDLDVVSQLCAGKSQPRPREAAAHNGTHPLLPL